MKRLPLDTLRKLIALLSSDEPGEVVAASAAIGRILKQSGADWHDLAAALGTDGGTLKPAPWDSAPSGPPKPHVLRADWCLRNGKLSVREKSFLESLLLWRFPSEKQLNWLETLESRTKKENPNAKPI